MTGNSDPISRHNWIYVTYSGRGDQTASDGGKSVNISHLVKLLMPLLESKTLKTSIYDNFEVTHGECLAIAS